MRHNGRLESSRISLICSPTQHVDAARTVLVCLGVTLACSALTQSGVDALIDDGARERGMHHLLLEKEHFMALSVDRSPIQILTCRVFSILLRTSDLRSEHTKQFISALFEQ